MSARRVPSAGGELVEPGVNPDLFCSELAIVETVGPCTRLVFAAAGASVHAEGRCEERTVVLRLIMPTEALAAMVRFLDEDAAKTASADAVVHADRRARMN